MGNPRGVVHATSAGTFLYTPPLTEIICNGDGFELRVLATLTRQQALQDMLAGAPTALDANWMPAIWSIN